MIRVNLQPVLLGRQRGDSVAWIAVNQTRCEDTRKHRHGDSRRRPFKRTAPVSSTTASQILDRLRHQVGWFEAGVRKQLIFNQLASRDPRPYGREKVPAWNGFRDPLHGIVIMLHPSKSTSRIGISGTNLFDECDLLLVSHLRFDKAK